MLKPRLVADQNLKPWLNSNIKYDRIGSISFHRAHFIGAQLWYATTSIYCLFLVFPLFIYFQHVRSPSHLWYFAQFACSASPRGTAAQAAYISRYYRNFDVNPGNRLRGHKIKNLHCKSDSCFWRFAAVIDPSSDLFVVKNVSSETKTKDRNLVFNARGYDCYLTT